MIITEIQNGLFRKVKQEQINLKNKVKNELNDILDELDRLNKDLLRYSIYEQVGSNKGTLQQQISWIL